jgi:hypothetical protein
MEDKYDQTMEDVTLRIVQEDVAILEKLSPIRTPETNAKELLVPGDTAVVRYREWLKQWDDNGWKIDLKALRARQGDLAMAIPCPGRRESGNWVLDAVPLMPPPERAASATTHELRA